MELRKDPITRSWVIVGDDAEKPVPAGYCPFCPGSPQAPQQIASVNAGAGAVTAMVHPSPLYRIEGEPQRRSEGVYDAMNMVGAHEVLVQSVRHPGVALEMARASMVPARIDRILAAVTAPSRVGWRKRLGICATLLPLAIAAAGSIATRMAPADAREYAERAARLTRSGAP